MSECREVRLICDNCGDYTDAHPAGAEAVKEAREYGWECTNGGHLCEDCVNVIDGEGGSDE